MRINSYEIKSLSEEITRLNLSGNFEVNVVITPLSDTIELREITAECWQCNALLSASNRDGYESWVLRPVE